MAISDTYDIFTERLDKVTPVWQEPLPLFAALSAAEEEE
jgi:hypothetical protein